MKCTPSRDHIQGGKTILIRERWRGTWRHVRVVFGVHGPARRAVAGSRLPNRSARPIALLTSASPLTAKRPLVDPPARPLWAGSVHVSPDAKNVVNYGRRSCFAID